VVAKLAKEDLDAEQFQRFARFLKRRKAEDLQNFVVHPQLDSLLSILREPYYVPIETFANLTDWQIIFLYIIPSVDRAVRELEQIAEMDRR
jgi:hypothetical protein